MPENTSKNKRRKFLLNPEFQLSFIGFMSAISCFTIAVIYAANRYFFYTFHKKGIEIGLPQDHVFFQFLISQEKTMQLIFILTAVIIFLFISIAGLFMSHRVAGPLFRMEQYLIGLIKGEQVSEMKGRKQDYFQSLFQTFNEFLKTRTKKE